VSQSVPNYPERPSTHGSPRRASRSPQWDDRAEPSRQDVRDLLGVGTQPRSHSSDRAVGLKAKVEEPVVKGNQEQF